MPKDFTDWIAKYNRTMGWPTIVVPKGAKGAVRSPERELTSLIDTATNAEKKLAKELGELNMTVQSLIHKVRDEKRDNEKFQAEHALLAAQKKQVELSAKHDIAQQLVMKRSRLLKQMKELDANIRKSITALNNEIGDIRSNPRADTPQGHHSRTDFDRERIAVAQEIDKVRATTVTLRDPNLSETKKFNGISTPEYTLLQTMLNKADALADGGGAGDGLTVIAEVRDKLDKMFKARRGVLLAETVPTRNPEVATPVGEAEGYIAALRKVGFVMLADQLQARLDLLDLQFVEGKQGLSLGLKLEDLVQPHLDFAEHCREKAAGIPTYRTAVEEMEKLVQELRILGEDDRADYAVGIFLAHEDGTDVPREITFVERRNEALRLIISNVRDGLLQQENVNPDELRQQYGRIKASVEDMYKHHRDRSRRTQKDAQSQQSKDVKKDSDIPRDALDEINMRLKMAEVLLESNSLDAYKRAGAMLQELEDFQTDIKTNSGSYEDVVKDIDELKSDHAHFEKVYRPYLLDRRSALKIAFDAFSKDYKKQDPKTNAKKIAEMKEESAKIRAECKILKAKRKEVDKKAGVVRKQIEEFGKLVVSAMKSNGDKKIEGYWGSFFRQLDDATRTAEKSDTDSLTTAEAAIDTLANAVRDAAAVVAKWGDKKKRPQMSTDENDAWLGIWDDVLRGQAKHKTDEVAAKKWRKELPVLKKKVEALKKSFKDLKLDMTDLDVLVLDLDAHETEQKARPEPVAALERLKEIRDTAESLERRAKSLEDFKSEPLDTSAETVRQHLRDFLDFVDGFEQTVRNADPDADTKYDLSNLAAFLDLVRDAVPTKAMDDLKSTTRLLARDTSLSAQTRELREKALADVRLIIGRLRTSTAIKHFASQTFATEDALEIALASLDRFQVKLLTALK